MQAMSQAGSCGQSSSQQGIEAMATSAVSAVAGWVTTVARTATATTREKKMRMTLAISAMSPKPFASANGFAVNAGDHLML
jgi:hypothetical protein